MKRKTTWLLAATLSLVLLHSLLAQQTGRSRVTLDQRLEEIEARLEGIEDRLTKLSPAQPMANSAEAKLDRLEARLIRLEETPLRGRGSVSPDSRLDSRIRSLERQVARLRRP